MGKKITLGDKPNEVLVVSIKGKDYEIPLLGALPMKKARTLKDEDKVMDFFAEFIPQDILDQLSINDFKMLADSWASESQLASGATPGES